VVAICHHGGRSQQVAMFLEKNGFAKVHNLTGGVDAWSRTVDPAVPLY
jgi:rhodanese-related sulfurtransferase